MPDLNVTIVLPSGGARNAEVPDDVNVRDLLAELASLLQLPTVGPDGRPMSYRLDSKGLGRELREDETLASASVPDAFPVDQQELLRPERVKLKPEAGKKKSGIKFMEEPSMLNLLTAARKPFVISPCRLKTDSL